MNTDESERASKSYEVAFLVGAVGSIILALFTLLGNRMAGLLALAAWSQVTLFVLPVIYVWMCKHDIYISPSLFRGPHQ